MEAQVREEVSREFSKLFSEMQDDFKWDIFVSVRLWESFGSDAEVMQTSVFVCVCVSERLVTEREILEERAERRLEIFKNLIDKMATAGPGPDTPAMVTRPLFLGSLNVMNAKNKKRLND